MEETTRLQWRLQRLQEKLKDLEALHIGNELNFTYWGGYEMGYLKGKINEIEEQLEGMEWIPINVDKLPEGEVLAANFKVGSPGYREKLVGWIGRINEPFCESNDTLLPDVTHYIDIHKFDVK